MTTDQDESVTRIRFLVRLGYWSSLLGGLTLPWIIIVVFDRLGRNVPWNQAWRSFFLHLFAPGYNFFLIGVLNVLPFVLFAIIGLFHLGTVPVPDRETIRRRAWASTIAGLTMAAVSAWTHVAVLLHPDAQGAIAYFFLPVTLMLCLPVGYALGWLAAKWRGPSSPSPA
jgi:hypothetical protein